MKIRFHCDTCGKHYKSADECGKCEASHARGDETTPQARQMVQLERQIGRYLEASHG